MRGLQRLSLYRPALLCDVDEDAFTTDEPLLLHDGGGDPDHDYDPGWDYELPKLPPFELLRAATAAAAQIAEASGEGFRCYAVNLREQNVLGRYCDGTQSQPVIVLDLDAHWQGCVRYGVPLDVALRTTIAHELGHARQERDGRPSDEVDAEAYAARLEASLDI